MEVLNLGDTRFYIPGSRFFVVSQTRVCEYLDPVTRVRENLDPGAPFFQLKYCILQDPAIELFKEAISERTTPEQEKLYSPDQGFWVLGKNGSY